MSLFAKCDLARIWHSQMNGTKSKDFSLGYFYRKIADKKVKQCGINWAIVSCQ